ncbi:hypothetical protein BH24ACI3_BH24ACI3_07630 [soil metagenome]
MEHAISIQKHSTAEAGAPVFAIDTTFVLFFLAMDLGFSVFSGGLDVVLSAATLGMFLIVPYFLPFKGERPDFGMWLLGRSLLAVFAFGTGVLLFNAVGTVLPTSFRSLPMTLLILSAIISCYTQLYGIIKLRLAR